MRFLLECTYVFDHPNDNSGIQRVVRNVINNIQSLQKKEPCIPVIFKRGNVFRVNHLKPLKFERLSATLREWVDTFRNRFWLLHDSIHRKPPFSGSRNLRRLLYLIFRLFSILYLIPLSLLVLFTRVWLDKERVEPIEVKKEDVLILLDSSWHATFFEDVNRLKRTGTTVIGVMYDLIPLTHPHFCDRHLVTVFKRWFHWITGIADGFMCISKTVSTQLEQFDSSPPDGATVHHRWYDSFYLGSELDQEEAGARISSRVETVYQQGNPVYLMVSTIEPRKNHTYLLDAFERLWNQGCDVSLCIVGKVGWKCDALIQRIETHPEREKRLFMLNGLTDSELAYCYQSSKALVFSSHVEGFGLPLIEALDRGLPVFASDIPVFREVLGDFGTYFSLSEPESLCRAIRIFESEDPALRKAMLASWKWLSWKDSTEQLLDRIKHHLDCQEERSRSMV